MAMRRPRVKVAANLSIRRPAKPAGDAVAAVKVETVKSEGLVSAVVASEPEVTPVDAVDEEEATTDVNDSGDVPAAVEVLGPVGESKPVQDVEQSTFKFPKPVEEPPRITTPAPMTQAPLEVNTDEPHSPKKLDSKFAYINALNSPRKRIRTESMTSNKSYSDVSLKSRKTIKQEVSQKASDARRDLRKRLNNIQNIDKQSLTMFDMIYYNPVKNPMKSPALSKKGSLENIPNAVGRESRGVSKSRSPTPAPAPSRPIPDPPKATVQMTPQLKLGPNGEMILDETSLVVENEREREMRDTLAKTEVIYMDEFSGNSGYYSRFKRTKDWPPEETIRFYRCLHTIGTDFSMMIQLFPNRSRRDLKLKFKKEERLNLMLVNKALLYPKEFNIEELKQQFEEEDEELERQRELERQKKLEAEEKLLQQKLAKKMQLNQNKSRNPKKRVSKSARVMLDVEQLVKSEPLMKESKPRKKRRKKEPTSEAQVPERQQQQQQQRQEKRVDDHPAVHEPDYEQKQVETVTAQKQELYPQSFQSCAEQFVVPDAEESALDIASMDISIVDEESRSVYEIKAEPNVHPVLPGYETIRTDRYADIPNVVTIQNLDDQSQTTMIYQEPTVTTTAEPVGIDLGLDSIEAKYYGACDVVYFPMPADAPIAHPVKTEPSYARRAPSPALQYDLLPASAPEPYRPPVVEPAVVHHEPEPEPIQQHFSPSPPPEVPSKVEHVEKQEQLPPQEEDEEVAPEVKDKPAAEEEGDPEEPRGLGPLEDIDINSLVLVESQDTQNPGRTIYEIYVADPDTGKLSEKPLDVPEDVIENIRSILEVGED
uniref:Putative transcription initiation factor tfiiib bdp1 subunit n=1 Tax=Culex tarsalis TaxID=7177 RepID=A0A1Q3EY76_CULTA